MIKRPTKYLITLETLAIASVVGVGFSAWGYGEQHGDSVGSVNLGVAGVIDPSTYFTFGEIDMFDYCKYGVVEDETIVYEGDIKIPFSVSMSSGVYSLLPSSTAFSFCIFVQCSPFNLFTSTYLGSSSPTVNYGISTSATPTSTSLTSTGTLSGGALSATISYSNTDLSTIATVYYVLSYHFDFSSVSSSFESSIYDNLKDGSDTLSVQIKVDM